MTAKSIGTRTGPMPGTERNALARSARLWLSAIRVSICSRAADAALLSSL
jgi:hypothetical protein